MNKEQKKKFTQIPDDWWELLGKHQVLDPNTNQPIKTPKGKDKTVTISHWMVALIAKIDNFNARTKDNQLSKCTASNAYFADLFQVAESTVKNALSDLYTIGLLKSYETKQGKKTTKRYLYLNKDIIPTLINQKAGTVQSTTPVPHEVPSSTPQSTNRYSTQYPNNKEYSSIKKYDNMPVTFGDASCEAHTNTPVVENHISFLEDGDVDLFSDLSFFDDDEI